MDRWWINSLVAIVVLCILSNFQSTGQTFTVEPSNVVVNASDSVSRECSYPNASGISWQKDGVTITGNNAFFNISSSPGMSVLAIRSASFEAHNGTYACIASLPSGGMTVSHFSVVVQFIGNVSVQVITDPCAGGEIYLNSNVTLRCSVSGSQPAIETINWFRIRNTVEPILSGVDRFTLDNDNTSLTITRITADYAAHYHCRVSNGPLMQNSQPVLLTVRTTGLPRQVVLNPPGERALVKNDSRFIINCTVTPPFPRFSPHDVNWEFGGRRLSSGNPDYALLVQTSCIFLLILHQISPRMMGTYRCVLGEHSAEISLVIAVIPAAYRVRLLPNTSVLGENSPIIFDCTRAVQDDPSANVMETISWYFVNRAGVRREVVADGSRIVMGSRSLTINKLRLSDAGTYTCNASHPLTESVLTNVTIDVEAAPQVEIVSSTTDVRLGTPLLINCTVFSSQRSASFQWMVNGQLLSNSEQRFSISSSPSISILNITEVMPQDLGEVTCTAALQHHIPVVASTQILETTQLYLLGDKQQIMKKVEQGTRVLSLNCPIQRRSESSIVQWSLGGMELRNGTEGVTLTNGNADVEIRGELTLADDNKIYVCEANDPPSSISLTYQVILFITIPASIARPPPPLLNVTEGTTAYRINCVVSGKPRPSVNWLQGNRLISNLDNPLITNFKNGTLLFQTVEKKHEAVYICFIPGSNQRTTLRVLPKRPSGVVGDLNRQETILIFTVGSVVALLLLISCPLLIIIGCCFCCQRRLQGTYSVTKHDSPDGGFLRQASLRMGSGDGIRKDNSDIMGSPINPIFDTLRQSPQRQQPQHNEMYPRNEAYPFPPPNAVALNTFNVGSTSFLSASHASSPMHGSMPSPMHESIPSSLPGTMASTSMLSCDEHTSSGLPNFPRNNIQLGDLMGQGEFGPVMKAVAKNLVPGQQETQVAVKLLVSETVEDNGFRADLAVVDYANQMKLEYKSIASILGICSDKEPFYVIYEYLDRGDLKNFLIGSRPEEGAPPSLAMFELLHVITQVADGMDYLFSQRIIHGDIASRNCLISSKLQVKIGDLGIGHELYAGDYYDNGTQLLPIRWMPPELLTVSSEESPSFSLHSDIWSFGVFCWEVMSFARLPYDNYGDEEVLAMIPAGSRLRSPSKDCPPALLVIMMDCWKEIPESRPHFDRILRTLAAIHLN